VITSEEAAGPVEDETYKVGEFEFTKKPDAPAEQPVEPAPTMPSIPMPESKILRPLLTDKPSPESSNGLESHEPEISRNK
jgi:hypothetical protein